MIQTGYLRKGISVTINMDEARKSIEEIGYENTVDEVIETVKHLLTRVSQGEVVEGTSLSGEGTFNDTE